MNRVKCFILDFWYWVRGVVPEQSVCDYCGATSPFYYDHCLHHSEELEDLIDREEGNEE
jgi:hypothetical protein